MGVMHLLLEMLEVTWPPSRDRGCPLTQSSWLLAVRNLAVSAPLFKSEASAAGPALKLSEILGNPKPYQGVEAGGRSGLSNLNLLNPGASWL